MLDIILISISIIFIYLIFRSRPVPKSETADKKYESIETIIPDINDPECTQKILLLYKKIYQTYTDPIDIETQTGKEVLPYIKNSSIQEIILELETSLYSGNSLPRERQEKLIEIFKKL
jgi:hypothetical protein